MLVSTSRPVKLTPGITRFEARYINYGFARISPASGIVAIATGARAPCIWHRDRELGNSEPGISIAYRVLYSRIEPVGARATDGITAIPQKDRCTVVLETLTND